MLVSVHASYAQVVIPRSVEAGEAERRVKPIPQPQAPISIKKTTPLPVTAPEGADKVRLRLNNVLIEGNTAYKNKELAELCREFLDKDVTLADIYSIAGRIQQHYFDDGYVLATVYLPPQEIDKGVVRIRVVEGYVAKVEWTGDKLDSPIVKALSQKLSSMRPFNGNTLEAVMLQLNDLPSVKAVSTLLPYKKSDAEEGATLLQINVEREYVSGQIGVDSNSSRYLGVWQENASININSVVAELDRFSLNGSSSADPQYSHYLRGEYSLPVNESGVMFRMGGSFSRSAPGFSLEALDVRSRAQSYWFGISQPILRSRAENLSLESQLTINNQTTDFLGSPLYEDRLRTLSLSSTYSNSDAWEGSNLVTISLMHGLDILDNTKTGSAKLSRPRGHSDFTKMTLNLSRLQTIDENFSLLLSSTGQMSNAPLLSSEQFGFGGTSFGRAYDSSELTGDEGVAASLELRYQSLGNIDDIAMQPFVFYDIGKVWNRIPRGNILSAASAGGGARITMKEIGTIELTAAQPLTFTPATPKLGSDGKSRRYGLSFVIPY